MKPMSQEALKRMALASGGKLQLDGQVVNSARLQVATKPPAPVQKADPAYMPEEPKPAPVQTIQTKPDPALQEAVLSIDNLAASQYALNESSVELMRAVQDTLQKVAMQAQDKRPTKWVFEVKRDAHNFIQRIEASAVYK